jgi:hypothetical protein
MIKAIIWMENNQWIINSTNYSIKTNPTQKGHIGLEKPTRSHNGLTLQLPVEQLLIPASIHNFLQLDQKLTLLRLQPLTSENDGAGNHQNVCRIKESDPSLRGIQQVVSWGDQSIDVEVNENLHWKIDDHCESQL